MRNHSALGIRHSALVQFRLLMNAWYYFWMANFFLAGSAFAVIAAIVLVRGLRDLREMFAGLASEKQEP